MDLFAPVAAEDRLNPSFVGVRDHIGHSAAKEMLAGVAAAVDDVDGNFVEQFQTTGFDQRVWELYLLACFQELGFQTDPTIVAPDFVLRREALQVAVEATTANPVGGSPPGPVPEDEAALIEYIRHELPIRLGSPLFSKLKKRYWEYEMIRGDPFCLAIESFASVDSLRFSEDALATYLYGLVSVPTRVDGQLVVETHPAESHSTDSKTIPSGFFNQPEAENVAAVLFSNAGTVGKFGRMGYQAGLGSEQILGMIRKGLAHDPDPNADRPVEFSYHVREHREAWCDGLIVIHNPHALHPLDDSVFPGTAQYRVDGDVIYMSSVPGLHVYRSVTIPLVPRASEATE